MLLTRLFSNLRFRTRLALVLLLVLVITSAVLFATYIRQNRRIKAYVAGITSDLLAISQSTHAHIPSTGSRTQALAEYMKALRDAGLSSVTVAQPNGKVVYSTNPRQVGKRITIKRRRRISRQHPIEISAEFPAVDVDAAVQEKAYYVEFPIVQGDKVIGWVRVHGFGDQFDALLRRADVVRSFWILATLLLGVFAMVYLAFLFTKPVDMLVEGARQVAQGNLYVSLPVKGKDEIGRLAQTFNQMVERLRQNRQLQERLNEAEKMSLLGHFAGSVAHEVRNSLNFMNLSIDQARAKQAASAASGVGAERAGREVQRNLANVKGEISRLNRLVNEFLSVGRQSPPLFELCEVRQALNHAVALVEKQAHAQEVRIHIALPDRFPAIEADRQQMETCFVNVLTNAIQAMPEGGEIAVTGSSLATEGGGPQKIELAFADTGPGIPTSDREKIFTPFFSTKATGFGLGLAITRKIVRDHGGNIYVRCSEAPGAVMIIELPASSASPIPAESAPSSAVPALSD